jgi:hypothetical protein
MQIQIPRLSTHEVKVQIRQMIVSNKSQIDAIRNNLNPGDPVVAQDKVNALVSDISLLEIMYLGAGE